MNFSSLFYFLIFVACTIQILTMYAGDMTMPYLAVLEAVSAMTAQLTLLSFAPTLKLEKIMTFQQSAEEKADTKTSHFSASLHEFLQKAVVAIGCHQPGEVDKKHSEFFDGQILSL